jgi:hypothetical protein
MECGTDRFQNPVNSYTSRKTDHKVLIADWYQSGTSVPELANRFNISKA